MAAAPAGPAVPPCIYDAPIVPAELLHQGFGVLPSHFTFHWTYDGRQRHVNLYKINDMYFKMNFTPFDPTKQFKHNRDQFNAFNAYVNHPGNLVPFTDAMWEMTQIGRVPECAVLEHHPLLGMFCSRDSFASVLRMKLFCAFGMLHNFVNHSLIKLVIRGGMALRLQLDRVSPLISTAPDTDMDGLIVVDPSIPELDKFKTTFMKLLVLSIKGSIPPGYTLICKPASGDSKTIKILVKTAFKTEFELGDFGFKYSNDEIVQMYEKPVHGIYPMSVPVYPGVLQCVWNITRIENMKAEYEHVFGNLMSESRERHLFHDSVPEGPEQRTMDKFKTKSEIATRGYGGKKRTMKRCTHKRGGSTTEQIGAAAQMRAFLPRHSATRNALNHIVHHESNNRFHDANYRHSPATQTAINKAFREINANPRVSRRTKKHMKIAKQKALTHRR